MRPKYSHDWFVATTCKYPRPQRWQPMKMSKAEGELRKQYDHNKGLMISAYCYPVEVSDEHTEGWGHLYFDFDGDSPTEALRDARKLVDYFTDRLGVEDQDIQCYFSGNKGYHVFVNASTFGIKPQVAIHKIYGYIATTLAQSLDLPTLDLSIYNRSRMIRVVNSIHEKSNRYRIQLPLQTMMTRPHIEIFQRAAKPGGKPAEFRFVDVPEEHHEIFFKTALEKWTEQQSKRPPKIVTNLTEHALKVDGLPTCVQDLLDRFMTSKYRFEAQSRIIAYFKETGVDEDECFDVLMEQIEKNYAPSEQADRAVKVRSAVKQIYAGDYTFNCRFALSVTKYEVGDDKVKCSGKACPLFLVCGNDYSRPEGEKAGKLMDMEI